MEGCFTFQWEGVFFSWWGASFLSGRECAMGGTNFHGGGGVQKKSLDGRGYPPMPPPSMGNPVIGGCY